jgi:hypothetical protein
MASPDPSAYRAARTFGEDAWNEGERRILKQFPPTAQINWADWKLRSDAFSGEN